MNEAEDAQAFLMGGGVAAARFENVNDKVVGIVKNMERRQQTDFTTKEPLTWKDGSPRWQVIFTLATDERDDEDDDGLRKLYAKGQMLTAIRNAVKKSGHSGLMIGGKLGVVFTGYGEARGGGQPPKEYAAKFEPGAQTADLDDGAEAAGDEPYADPDTEPF